MPAVLENHFLSILAPPECFFSSFCASNISLLTARLKEGATISSFWLSSSENPQWMSDPLLPPSARAGLKALCPVPLVLT